MKNKILKATHQGIIKLAGFEISCAVLDNDENTRILVDRSVANAFGVKGSGAYWKRKREKGALLPEYISQKYLKPFISNEVFKNLSEPISYITINGKKTQGIPAISLPDICDIWIKSKQKGALQDLPHKIDEIAENAYLILKGFAHVGIIALVDEATGYQEIRDRLALNKILEKYITDELQKWAKKFPDEFYKEIFRLNNWEYNPKNVKRPSVIGTWTKNLVYRRFPPNVLKALEDKNPLSDKGYRKYKHHQYLTEEIGNPKLKEYISNLIFLMKASSNWKKFIQLFERSTGNYQISLFEEG